MKKNNIWHIVWLVGIYVILFIILYLVIEYKVKWENRDLSTYLYFYNCSNNLCTTTNSKTDSYGKIKCEKDICPTIEEKEDNLVILSTNDKRFVYDYINDKIISDTYKYYHFNNDNIIYADNNNKYGVISKVGEKIVENTYDEIIDYRNGFIAYKKDNKVGIINEEKKIDVKPTYSNVILLNNNNYAYLEDNKYYIAAYNTEIPTNNTNYNYIYSIDEANTIVIKDKKLDIIDENLKSRLILKLDTYYEYGVEKERASLNLVKEDNLLRFSIINDKDGNKTNYIYDIKNKKLYS